MEIRQATGQHGFRYQSYSAARFDGGRYPGVSLQFVNLLTGEEPCAVFNADLDRERTSKGGRKGTPLPSGQFRVGERYALWKLWQVTGLPEPRRRSELYEVIHKLNGIVMAADRHSEKPGVLVASSVRPLQIGPETIREAFGFGRQEVGKASAINRQSVGNRSATVVGKDASQNQAPPDAEPDLSRVCFEPRKKQEVNKEARRQESSFHASASVEIESTGDPECDEWLADYNRRDAEILAAENLHPDYDVRMAGYEAESRRLLMPRAQ